MSAMVVISSESKVSNLSDYEDASQSESLFVVLPFGVHVEFRTKTNSRKIEKLLYLGPE